MPPKLPESFDPRPPAGGPVPCRRTARDAGAAGLAADAPPAQTRENVHRADRGVSTTVGNRARSSANAVRGQEGNGTIRFLGTYSPIAFATVGGED